MIISVSGYSFIAIYHKKFSLKLCIRIPFRNSKRDKKIKGTIEEFRMENINQVLNFDRQNSSSYATLNQYGNPANKKVESVSLKARGPLEEDHGAWQDLKRTTRTNLA